MRWRTSHAWALGGVLALAFLLLLAGHPALNTASPAGLSAPSVPSASIESASAVQFLQSHFEWHGLVAQRLSSSHADVVICATDGAQHVRIALSHYGPLHRRPPPSIS